MCGIFGIAGKHRQAEQILRRLYLLSESRGKESAGLAVVESNKISVLKSSQTASRFIKTKDFNRSMEKLDNEKLALICHSRLATNGALFEHDNNQPVISAKHVVVHNGIIVNDAEIWQKFPSLQRQAVVDTEVIAKLLDYFCDQGLSLEEATQNTFKELEGAASIAVLSATTSEIVMATNNASLYIMYNKEFCLFASERLFLDILAEEFQFSGMTFERLTPQKAYVLNYDDFSLREFNLSQTQVDKISTSVRKNPGKFLARKIDDMQRPHRNLKRCSRCILPSTFPYINFDQEGVCNYCRRNFSQQVHTEAELEAKLAKIRKGNGEPDCLVAFSGGRDSCYGLHLLVKKYKMTPIVFTYDWGMVTDIARRNSSRMCAKLGVEHIIVSANIAQKRKYIRLNVNAWLKKPHLGMIPLFMAGDKMFYYYAQKVCKQNNLKTLLFCDGNTYEKTDFKTGFCGIQESNTQGTLKRIPLFYKLKMLMFYAGQFLSNPSYLNQSLIDSFKAYYSSYFTPDDFIHLFHYEKWDEQIINRTLIEEYNWELATDTPSTWRIGDGTASFYNYIYHTVAGFSEHDTFRSNQIRAGAMTREKALEHIEAENRPRTESIKEYFQIIGASYHEAMAIINRMDKIH